MKIRYDKREATVLVCRDGSKKKAGTCNGRGAASIAKKLRSELKARGLDGSVRVRKSGCLGVCSCGPALVTYPDGAICTRVTSKDVVDLAEHLERVARASRRARAAVREVTDDKVRKNKGRSRRRRTDGDPSIGRRRAG